MSACNLVRIEVKGKIACLVRSFNMEGDMKCELLQINILISVWSDVGNNRGGNKDCMLVMLFE